MTRRAKINRKSVRSLKRRASMRRGLTLLETIFSTVLIASTAGLLANTVSDARGSLERQRNLLGAAEVANRLILIQIDNPKDLPQPGSTIDYDGRSFRWDVRVEQSVSLDLSEQGQIAMAEAQPTLSFGRRVQLITAEVWLAEQSGGAFNSFDARNLGVAHVNLARLQDALGESALKADSINRIGAEEFARSFVELMADPLLSGAEDAAGAAGGNGTPNVDALLDQARSRIGG